MIKEKQIRTLTAALLSGAVLTLAAGFLLCPKAEFSENENRYLASFPKPVWEQIKSGQYMEDLGTYLSDHFPLRDFFMGEKAAAEILQGRREINGVYIGEDGYLIEEYKKPQNTERISGILKSFAQELEMDREKRGEGTSGDRGEDLRLRLMLVPTAAWTYRDKLPALAPVRDQMETAKEIYTSSGIEAVDCSPELLDNRKSGQLYYRTDHHWTTRGAYVGYEVFCREMGFEPVPLEQLEAETVTEDFCGTIYSKVNDYRRQGDAITVYTDPADRLTVSYTDTGEVSDSLYNLDYVDKKDKYSLFLDNLHSLIEITNENADSDRELALIKDSYANSMVPFLVRHYKKIYVFDTRSYKMGPSVFIKEHPGITDVLLLYNMNTLDTDLGIRGIY